MSDFALDLIKKYNQGPTEILLNNMQKIDRGFNTDNIFALAYLATCEAVPEADREIFKQLIHMKIEQSRGLCPPTTPQYDTSNNVVEGGVIPPS